MTQVVIDKDIDAVSGQVTGVHTVDVDEVGLTGSRNPTGLPDPITMLQYLAWLNGNVARQTQAGWRVSKQLPGEGAVNHRWGRLVTFANSGTAPAALKALTLA